MVARQRDRTTREFGHRSSSGNHPAVAQRASSVEDQHPAVGHITRAQGSVGPTVTDLQHPTLDHGQTSESVSPGPSYRVSSLLRDRASAGKVAHQGVRVGTVKHQRRVVNHVPGQPTRRPTSTQLQRSLRNRRGRLTSRARQD